MANISVPGYGFSRSTWESPYVARNGNQVYLACPEHAGEPSLVLRGFAKTALLPPDAHTDLVFALTPARDMIEHLGLRLGRQPRRLHGARGRLEPRPAAIDAIQVLNAWGPSTRHDVIKSSWLNYVTCLRPPLSN